MRLKLIFSIVVTVVLNVTIIGCSSDDSGEQGDTDSSRDSVADTGADNDTGTGEEIDTGTGVAVDTVPDTQCEGLEDYAACNVVTSPDRSYDICIKGSCLSPGCGSWKCNAPGPHFPLPDTNQRICANETTAITCQTVDQPFYGQDGQYGWDITHAAAERFTRDTGVENYPTVIDNVTGLIWQGCTFAQNYDDCSNVRTNGLLYWDSALAYCEELSWGGYDDWRLPDEYELLSIVDYGRQNPSIDLTAFPSAPAERFYTSSARYNYGEVQIVWFGSGNLDTWPKDGGGSVRCVRAGAMKARSFESAIMDSARVVTDSNNLLMWQGCSAGYFGENCEEGVIEKFTWQDALAFCEGLSSGGNTDWRLPDIKELQSIVDNSVGAPAIDELLFPRTPPHISSFWSSTSSVSGNPDSYTVDFYGGDIEPRPRTESLYVRCVTTMESL